MKLPQATQQIAFQEYLHSVTEATALIARLEGAISETVAAWRLYPVVQALQALRGVALISAATLVAEIGDIGRFAHPRQLMAYLGLVPSEHSSGNSRRLGAITRAGNTMPGARWSNGRGTTVTRRGSHRFYKSAWSKVSPKVCEIAWRA